MQHARLRLQQKLLIGSLSLLIFILAILFALTLLQLRKAYSDKEQEEPAAHYLKEEESVIVYPSAWEFLGNDALTLSGRRGIMLPVDAVLFEYIEVTGGCGPQFEGACLNARSGPGVEFPSVAKLRNGTVLKVGGSVTYEDRKWYKIVFDEWIRYPERVEKDWFVAADYVRVLFDEGNRDVTHTSGVASEKRIVVSRSEQTLYAYDGEELFMQEKISTGLELTPTPRGTFTIYRKSPSRYMQGPLLGITEQEWDLPGVPWNLYFTEQGAVIHGAYWHNNFGAASSHGCVNMRPADAEKLYKWAEIGTKVIVRD